MCALQRGGADVFKEGMEGWRGGGALVCWGERSHNLPTLPSTPAPHPPPRHLVCCVDPRSPLVPPAPSGTQRDLRDLGCHVNVINNCQALDRETRGLGLAKDFQGVLFL